MKFLNFSIEKMTQGWFLLFFFQFFLSFCFGGWNSFFSSFFCNLLVFASKIWGEREKKHMFLKYCLKWSKWRWSNHCSYKGIVPTFRDLPRASESAEIWCKATRIRDFSRWKKFPLGVLEIVYITFPGKNRVFTLFFILKGPTPIYFLGFWWHYLHIFFPKSIPMTLQGHRCGLCRQAFSGRAQLLLTERMSQHVAKRKAEWLK